MQDVDSISSEDSAVMKQPEKYASRARHKVVSQNLCRKPGNSKVQSSTGKLTASFPIHDDGTLYIETHQVLPQAPHLHTLVQRTCFQDRKENLGWSASIPQEKEGCGSLRKSAKP